MTACSSLTWPPAAATLPPRWCNFLKTDIPSRWEWPCGDAHLRFQRDGLMPEIWDRLQIWLHTAAAAHLLYDDILREGISSLTDLLPSLLAGEAPLPPDWHARGLGYHFSALEGALTWADDLDSVLAPDPTAGHWLWSRPVNAEGGLQTWLYNQGAAIWLEVSPGAYGQEYRDAHPAHTLEDYLNQYGPVWRTELSREQAQRWLTSAQGLLAKMKSQSGSVA